MMKICIIFNKYSGSFTRLGDDPMNLVQHALDRIGHGDKQIIVKVIEGQDITKTVHESVEEGFDVITASGGDGTINTVVNALHGSGKTLGILPMGTFNHFAKDAGIPLDFDSAIKNLLEGEARAIDVAEVNGHLFVNNSSVGHYPTTVIRREEARKKHNVNKIVAMIFAVFKRHCSPLIFTIAGIFRTSKEEKVKNFSPLKSRVFRIFATDDPENP